MNIGDFSTTWEIRERAWIMMTMRGLFNIRGLPFMTSALRGEGVPSKADIVRNLLREVA